MFLHPCQVYLLRLPTFLHPQALWWEMKVQDDKKRRRDLVPRKEQEGILPAPMEYLRTEGGLDFPPFASSVLPPSPFLHSHHYFLSPLNPPTSHHALLEEKKRLPHSSPSPTLGALRHLLLLLLGPVLKAPPSSCENPRVFFSLSSLVPHLTKEKRKEHAAFPRLFGGCLRAPSLFQKCPHAPHPMDGDGQAPYEPRHHCPAQSPEEDLICVAPPPL